MVLHGVAVIEHVHWFWLVLRFDGMLERMHRPNMGIDIRPIHVSWYSMVTLLIPGVSKTSELSEISVVLNLEEPDSAMDICTPRERLASGSRPHRRQRWHVISIGYRAMDSGPATSFCSFWLDRISNG